MRSEIERHNAQRMVDKFKASVQASDGLPRWHRPRSEAERIRMQQEALEELSRPKMRNADPQPVSYFLARQMAGEHPIGEGHLGCMKIVTITRAEARARQSEDGERWAELDSWAKETLR